MASQIIKPTAIKRSLELWKEAQYLMPGGTQLMGRRPQLFAFGVTPILAERAEGAYFWDVDGNRYLDTSMSLGAVLLGYCDPDVENAVDEQQKKGTIFPILHPVEIEMARLVTEVVPCAEMVRFGKSGGEANAVVVRIARAFTGRDKVAFCGYHGWHDWYISANLADPRSLESHLLPGVDARGIPRALLGTSIPFEYNNIDYLKKVFDDNKNQIACVIMDDHRVDDTTSVDPGLATSTDSRAFASVVLVPNRSRCLLLGRTLGRSHPRLRDWGGTSICRVFRVGSELAPVLHWWFVRLGVRIAFVPSRARLASDLRSFQESHWKSARGFRLARGSIDQSQPRSRGRAARCSPDLWDCDQSEERPDPRYLAGEDCVRGDFRGGFHDSQPDSVDNVQVDRDLLLPRCSGVSTRDCYKANSIRSSRGSRSCRRSLGLVWSFRSSWSLALFLRCGFSGLPRPRRSGRRSPSLPPTYRQGRPRCAC